MGRVSSLIIVALFLGLVQVSLANRQRNVARTMGCNTCSESKFDDSFRRTDYNLITDSFGTETIEIPRPVLRTETLLRDTVRVPQTFGYGQQISRDETTRTTTTTTTTTTVAYGGYGQRQQFFRDETVFRQPVVDTYSQTQQMSGYGQRQQIFRDETTRPTTTTTRTTTTTTTVSYGGYGQRNMQQLFRDETRFQEPTTFIQTSLTETQLTATSCGDSPCLNEGVCVALAGGFTCKCPWGWTGKFCEICVTECASNPCPSNKKCKARYGGGFDCVCPTDKFGQNCEFQNDACSINPCLNGGKCKPAADGLFTCTCLTPFAGKTCEARWNNPCTQQVLLSLDVLLFKYPWDETKYIVCTDIDEWVAMSCADSTIFNEDLGHCVPRTYEAPLCPQGFCANDGECTVDEAGNLGCLCKAGFTGRSCEVDIDECRFNGGACSTGRCIDQINTYFCECPTGYGLDCLYTMDNPCTQEAIDAEEVYWKFGTDGHHYLHCTAAGLFTVRKCAGGLYWNQEEKTCTLDKPLPTTGVCSTFPCKNAGHCVDLGGPNFRCDCKEGWTGQLCEVEIDFCASNPCMNGGRCLSYRGGYTCVCPDNIVDECCCNGVMNPCPQKPGLTSYFPHLFPHRYFQCGLDGKAYVRTCAAGLRWNQQVLTCLPGDFEIGNSVAVATSEDATGTSVNTNVDMGQKSSFTNTGGYGQQTVQTFVAPQFLRKQTTTTTFTGYGGQEDTALDLDEQTFNTNTYSQPSNLPASGRTIVKSVQQPVMTGRLVKQDQRGTGRFTAGGWN